MVLKRRDPFDFSIDMALPQKHVQGSRYVTITIIHHPLPLLYMY